MQKRKAAPLWPALLSLCLGLFLAGCDQTEQQPEPAEVAYEVMAAEYLTLNSELPGRVCAEVTAEVRPQVDGIIQARLFEEGARVNAGQVLYQIDPAMYQAALNTAQAALEEAEANVTALERLETRYRQLIGSNSVSRQELDNAVAEHGQARARVARARAELETAAIRLAYTQIKAPVSGRIGRSSVTPGALVAAGQADVLAVIHQTDRVYVDFSQAGADLLRLRRSIAQNKIARNGGSTKVRLLLEDGTPYTLMADHQTVPTRWIIGNLLFSEVFVSRSTGSVVIRAVFDNPEGLLLPGMYVKAVMEEGVMENAVLAPQQAVISDGSGGHYALVLRPAEAEQTPPAAAPQSAGQEGQTPLFRVERTAVRPDRAFGNRWIMASGLAPGDLLVVEGLQKAVPGEMVRGRPASADAKAQAAPATPVDGGAAPVASSQGEAQ